MSLPPTLTSLIGLGLQTYVRRRISALSDADHWRAHAGRLQLRQLRSNLSFAASTEFGREHEFSRLAALSDADLLPAYRSRVPLADWYAFRDRIARMRENAEPDLLWPGLVRDFAQTSGTTAGDKFIPVSAQMLKSNYRASLDIFSHLRRFGVSLPTLMKGKSLFMGGSTKLETSSKGIRTGDLSGIVTPLIKWPLSEIYLPGADIALISHWPSKIDAMARRCLREDVRMVSGMCSWGLILFEKVVELARQEGRNVSTIRDVWPNFTVFVHGGVRYTPFEPRVRQIYSGSPSGPDVPCRLELYPASEAFIAIQDTPHDPGLRLLTDIGNFIEFVPLESIDLPHAPAFACNQVEKGQKYVVVLSSCAGLWRYILGDVVQFDSIPDRPNQTRGDGPPRLRIVGRHRHFINAFGENLIVEHVENAVSLAARQSGLLVGEFTAAPVYPENGRQAGLELAIEIQSGAPRHAQLAFAAAFDATLKSQNVDYTTKRTDGVGMAAPDVTWIPIGSFHRWMESRGKLGGQHKCPRCANSREIIDQVLQFARGTHSENDRS